MKYFPAIIAAVTLSQLAYANESSSIENVSEETFGDSAYYNVKDYVIRDEQLDKLNSELDRIAGLVSDLKKDKSRFYENEIGNALIQPLEGDDSDEKDDNEKENNKGSLNGFGDSKDEYMELSLRGKRDPIDDELNDLDRILNTAVQSVEGLLNAILNPIIGDRATGRNGVLNNLVDKLGNVLDKVDNLLDPKEPRRPRKTRPREDSYNNEDALELASDNVKEQHDGAILN